MKKLNILFNTSPGSFGSWGGGEIQLLETKRELEKMGHKVKIWEEENYDVDLSEFDVFHNFNIHRVNLEFVLQAKKAGLPVAVSTIYWPGLKSILKWDRGVKVKAKNIAAELARTLRVPKLNKAREIIKKADVLLPNSKAEAKILEKQFGVDKKKIQVVPNGVDKRFAGATPGLFEKKFGLKNFVLYVGRIEERKNVLSLVKAMNGVDATLVVVGKAKQGSECYLRKCKKAADGNAKFLDPIPHESKLLESAYAACKVFCLPSWYETPGLAALEAGLAGANIVVTQEGCAKEYFGEFASYINPESVDDIRTKILEEIEKPGPKGLSSHIAKNFLWKNAAEKTAEAYEKILG
ncbi:MAG: glycosyltransferase [archaeon]|jgi:glycosyltransferase involved in cell wall biosynthesis|nr:glycosyltransferase [archaeon]